MCWIIGGFIYLVIALAASTIVWCAGCLAGEADANAGRK